MQDASVVFVWIKKSKSKLLYKGQKSSSLYIITLNTIKIAVLHVRRVLKCSFGTILILFSLQFPCFKAWISGDLSVESWAIDLYQEFHC